MSTARFHVGFTGTRKGMTRAQRFRFADLICRIPMDRFAHGDCRGADALAHDLVCALGGVPIRIHPPTEPALRAWCHADDVLPPLPYLERNYGIVDGAHILIATPRGPEELRSGTWATVRYARKRRRLVIVIAPDSAVTHEMRES